jgi:hypothetical protein
MKGSDLLDKLENLDPGLVAGAAEPPREKARRRGFEWGGLIAVAACIVAIGLPLLLTYLINGVTPTIEYGPGSRQGSTSHQVSAGDEGPGGGDGLGDPQKGAHKGGDDGPTATYSTYNMEPQVSVMGYKDYITWTRYTLDEQYCAVYPEGLPAEEYFKYNVQGLGAIPELWDGMADMEPWDSEEADEAVSDFSGLLTESMKYTKPTISADLYSEYQRMSIQTKCGISWRSDGSDSRLTVDICEISPVDAASLAKVTYWTDETVAIFPKDNMGGQRIVYAMGGLDSDRCLYTWLPFTGIWCRIAAGSSVPVEDMAAILDWLFSGPELLGQIHPLASYNPEVYPYIPTPKTNDYAAPIGGTGAGLTGRAGQNQNEQKVLGLEISYLEGYDGRPLERYAIDRLDSYEGKDESMGALAGLTRDEVEKEYSRQRGAMGAERSSDVYKRDQPMHYTFHFTWDDYYVTAVFSEELTADGLWSFLQQLSGKETATGTDAYTAPLLAAE